VTCSFISSNGIPISSNLDFCCHLRVSVSVMRRQSTDARLCGRRRRRRVALQTNSIDSQRRGWELTSENERPAKIDLYRDRSDECCVTLSRSLYMSRWESANTAVNSGHSGYIRLRYTGMRLNQTAVVLMPRDSTDHSSTNWNTLLS